MNEDRSIKPITPLEYMCKRMGEVYGPSARALVEKIENRQKLAKQEKQNDNGTIKTLDKSSF